MRAHVKVMLISMRTSVWRDVMRAVAVLMTVVAAAAFVDPSW